MGAGRSGLFAAVELARRGVVARVLERAPQPPQEARATGLQPGTLELLAEAGLAEEFPAAGVPLRLARVFDQERPIPARRSRATCRSRPGCRATARR